MTPEALLTPRPAITIGRKRTTHLPRVLIEDNAVVIRTRCGLDPIPEGFTETYALITCDECEAS